MTFDCTCVAVFADEQPLEKAGIALWRASGFTGASGQTLLIQDAGHPKLLVGMGDRNKANAAVLRASAAEAGRTLAHLGALAWDIEDLHIPGATPDEVARCLGEGVKLGAYRYEGRQSDTPKATWRVPNLSTAAWERGEEMAKIINFVRDLVNTPANDLTPSRLAEQCRQASQASGLQIRVLGEQDIVDGGLGGVFAVGRGSVERPCIVELTYPGHHGVTDLSLVGKGVTFDSGGLSLKNAEGQMVMKRDMAGAATILGAMMLARTLAPRLRVKAFLPLVENLPGPDAVRPGDVVTMRNGATVEVLNTDFEGRLILADALALAGEERPRFIVDVATLTSAAVHALGDRTAALFSNSIVLEAAVTDAAKRSSEPVWPMPMPAHLETQLRSQVADYKNFPGSPNARSLTAAMFLQAFVPADIEWAHLDITGPAWATSGYGLTGVGATGYGVRLLGELMHQLDPADS